MNTTVSERLNQLMESRGIKQVDLVNSINKYIEDNDLDVRIGKSAISQYVSGKVVPKQDKVFVMAAALDVDPSWLLGIKTLGEGINIGQRIKDRRKELNLSAEQVAELIGVSPATVYRYESNYISNMGVDKITPIAKALNTTEAYLLGWTDDVDLSTMQEGMYRRLVAYQRALKKNSYIKTLFDTISDLDDKQSMRVYDLLTDYLSCDEYSQGRISAYANMLAFGYADTKNIDDGIDKENAEFRGKFTRHLSEDDVDASDEPDGPHPYHGPDEDLVRAVAEKDTKKTLEDLKDEVKAKDAAREAKRLYKGRPAK